MQKYTIKLLKNDGLVSKSSEGRFSFSPLFTKEELEGNKFYYSDDLDLIVQINKNSQVKNPIKGHSYTFTKEQLLKITDNLNKEDAIVRTHVKENLRMSDVQYFNELGILEQGTSTNEEYLENITRNFKEFKTLFKGIEAVYPEYKMTFYPFGVVEYSTDRLVPILSEMELLKEVLRITGIHNEMNYLYRLEMKTKKDKLQKLEGLFQLLEEHSGELPKEITDYIDADLLDYVEELKETITNKN